MEIRLVEYMRQFASRSRRNDRYKRKLRNISNKLEEFEVFLGRKLNVSDFDDRLMEELDYFFRNHPKKYRRSTINGFGQNISTFIGKAKKSGYNVNMSYSEYKFPEGEFYAIVLAEEEIEAIYNLTDLSNEQKNARFWLIFNCYTAFRFSDLKRILSINVEKDIISMRTQKTNVEVKIPLHWRIKAMLKEYNNTPPNLTSQQNYGNIIKRICRKAKVIDKVLIERHEGTQFVRKSVPKWQLVSAHTARRSFATNAYLSGIKVARIMLLTGHKTESSFFKYIQIEKNENVKYLAKHDFFAGVGSIDSKKNNSQSKKIARKLKAKRLERNLSIQDLADKTGFPATTIERIEKDLIFPKIDVVCTLCDALDVSLNIQ